MAVIGVRPAGGDDVGRGILLAMLAVLVFSTQDVAAKILVETYSPFQLTMMRYWAFAAVSLIWAMRQAPLRQVFRSVVPMIQVMRALLLVADVWLYAMALRGVPLAELQAIILIYPLLVTLAAIPILGEKVGMFRFVAVLAGFGGAMIIVRPGGVPMDINIGYALGAAVTYALYIVLTRRAARTDKVSTSMVYVGVVGLVLTTAVGVFFWQPMDATGLALMAFVMVTSSAAHGLMMTSLSLAPASVLQPLSYTSLPWSIGLSYLVFGHLIDPISLVGATIIVAAGLVVMARERFKKVPSAVVAGLPGKE